MGAAPAHAACQNQFSGVNLPQRPNKPCLHRGCAALTRAPSGYCEEHHGEASGWAEYNAGKTQTQRGYGNSWRKLRDWIMRRDGGLCQVCAAAGKITPATEVDHIISKAEGARLNWTRQQIDDHANLRAICASCHKAKTAIEHTRRGAR